MLYNFHLLQQICIKSYLSISKIQTTEKIFPTLLISFISWWQWKTSQTLAIISDPNNCGEHWKVTTLIVSYLISHDNMQSNVAGLASLFCFPCLWSNDFSKRTLAFSWLSIECQMLQSSNYNMIKTYLCHIIFVTSNWSSHTCHLRLII